MKELNFNKYFCTEEQTRRIYELGAPLDTYEGVTGRPVQINNEFYETPTIQEALSWFASKNKYIQYKYVFSGDTIVIEIWSPDPTGEGCIFDNGFFEEAYETGIDALNAVIKYFTEHKTAIQ